MSFCLHQPYLGFFISSFISLYSLQTLFTETNSSRLIYVSIKDLGIKTSIVSDFVFARNTVLSYVFFFLLKIDLSLLIPAVIAQIVTPTAELAIPTEIQPLTVYMEIKKYSK